MFRLETLFRHLHLPLSLLDSLQGDDIDHVTTVPELWAQWHACYGRDTVEFVSERGLSAEQATLLLALVRSYDDDGPRVDTTFTSHTTVLSERELWALWVAFHGRNDDEFISDGVLRWNLGGNETEGLADRILELVHRFDMKTFQFNARVPQISF